MTPRQITSAAAAVLVLTLSACGGGSRVKPLAAPPAGSSADTIGGAFDRLMAGDEGAARKQLRNILKRDQNDAQAQLLLGSMERDPIELLGPESYPYTVRSGDTIEGLAQRLLGNRFKAYQLLRYNKLAAPATLIVGDIVRIPGEPPRPATVRRPDPAPSRAAATPAPVTKAKAVPTAPVANPAAARQARAAGLAALNQGHIVRAVSLLRRSNALDPGNPLVARDLARAERIAATVRATR